MKNFLNKSFQGMIGLVLVTTMMNWSPGSLQAAEPEDALIGAVEALKANDLGGLIRSAVGDDEYAKMGEEWEKQRQQIQSEITEQDRAQFAGFMSMLTAPGSEDLLMTMIEPQLAQFQMSLAQFVAMFQGLGAMQIQQMQNIDAAGKQNLMAALQATSQWMTTQDLTNRDKARAAVELVVVRAREFGINTLDELTALDYDGLLGKGGQVLGLGRELLAHYQIDLYALLNSVEVQTLENDGQNALVAIRFDFLGIPQQFKSKLVRQGDQWVSEDALRQAQMVSVLANMPRQSTVTESDTMVLQQQSTTSTVIAQESQISESGANTGFDANWLQDSLNSNPFIHRYGMDLYVADFADGFATLELNAAPDGLISAVQQGQDLVTLTPASLPPGDDRLALAALQKVLQTLSGRGGIESIMILPGQ